MAGRGRRREQGAAGAGGRQTLPVSWGGGARCVGDGEGDTQGHGKLTGGSGQMSSL